MENTRNREIENYFNQYHTALCRYCAAKMPRHANCSEDIVSEAFVLLCEKWHQLEKSDIRAWLHRTIDVLLLKFFRKRAEEAKRMRYIEDIRDLMDGSLAYEQNFETISDDAVDAYREKILAALPEKERRLFAMNFVERVPHKEICTEFSLSEEALKKRLYRLKQKINFSVSDILKYVD